jgi:hypothetical protein
MRLEILVDSEEPVIYALNKPEIVIGSGDSCDIILGSAGVSRKHLKVLVEGDSYFVLDQGSTNGTFINEERLVPGRKTEFTSFFPVRMGSRVLLTLLSDEEAQDSILREFSAPKEISSAATPSDTTRVLSLKDIQATSTKKLIKNRQEVVARKKSTKAPVKKAKPKTDLSMLKSVFFAVMIFAAAAYYNFYFNQPVIVPPPEIKKIVTAADIEKAAVAVVPAGPAASDKLIADAELIPLPRIKNLFSDLKCLIPEEIYFCDLIPTLKKGNGGVAAVGESIVFLVDQSVWFSKAQAMIEKSLVKPTLDAEGKTLDIEKMAFLFFLHEALRSIDMTNYKDKNFYIAFYLENEKELNVSKVFAFKISLLPDMLNILSEPFFANYRTGGSASLDQLQHFYRIY